jgi:hypothetical protein
MSDTPQDDTLDQEEQEADQNASIKRREEIRQLYEKYGIPFKDTTEESIGQTSIWIRPRTYHSTPVSGEAFLRNLNRRKKRE